MLALLQRVRSARVEVDGAVVGSIDAGLLVYLGFARDDQASELPAFLAKVASYRVFADAEGKMNLSARALRAPLLLVPQFTLAANTRKGLRPNFTPALAPELARPLFTTALEILRADPELGKVAAGEFGAHMLVSSVNDGPINFILNKNND